ncbi:Double-strand break repair protein mre11a [Lunasporangiospora selenospora]|uniref:Double-strand break repair protein mre11a n=1 Tax=Lunasporangiospora selenospora TaxID=979761 RepID=A0A9P6KGT7_9FUNG|nr:Double-strand break repair protein mre11a [Lunasporangiospora selenospora]
MEDPGASQGSSVHAQLESSQLQNGEGNDLDTFTILVATDNHLGYLEKDPVRGNDSFAAFEEILALAAESEANMILLGGDLFHENKPSRKTMHITSKLLRKYCMGDKPVSIEYLSRPSDNFPEGVENVNYMDPNLNVAIPVFSIHGNHDDPSGDGNLCALDLLAMNGLVNYFGRSYEIDNVVVKPILLRKGTTRLALYGIGNIRDERLYQTFSRRNVKFLRPLDGDEDEDEERDEEGEHRGMRPEDDKQLPWYNLLVLHQNRVMHGPKSYIPEAFLDDFIDLVLWGHEHECLIDPMYNPQQGFHVTQPGSSVATSLSEGESKEKHVAILKICNQKFNLQKIRLQSVRPFIMGDCVLADENLDPTNQQKVAQFISRKVKELIQKAKDNWIAKNSRTSRKRRMYQGGLDSDEDEPSEVQGADGDEDKEHEPQVPKPLVRLRVEYSGGFEIFNPQRFGHEFIDVIANPRDVVQFYRKKTAVSSKQGSKTDTNTAKIDKPEKLDTMRVENLVEKYLSAQNLRILPEVQLADAVRTYVEKDEKDALKDFVSNSLGRMQKVMKTKQNIEYEEALLKEINKEKDNQANAYTGGNPRDILAPARKPADDTDMDMDQDLQVQPKRGTRPSVHKANEKGITSGESDKNESDVDLELPTRTSRGRGGKTTGSSRAKGTSAAATRGVLPVGRRRNATAASVAKSKTQLYAEDSQEEEEEEKSDDGASEVEHRTSSTVGRRATVGKKPDISAYMIPDTDEEDNLDKNSSSIAGTKRLEKDQDEDFAVEGVVETNEEDEDEDEDFLVPRRGGKAKGKGRAANPPKAQPRLPLEQAAVQEGSQALVEVPVLPEVDPLALELLAKVPTVKGHLV